MILKAKQVDALCVPADVSDPKSVQAAVDATLHRFGRIDILVHSILPPHLLKPVLELDDADLPAWQNSVSTSVFGALTVSRGTSGQIIEVDGGRFFH